MNPTAAPKKSCVQKNVIAVCIPSQRAKGPGCMYTVTLGWIWTTAHQPPPLRTASHLVLGVAALAGIFALAKIWRA